MTPITPGPSHSASPSRSQTYEAEVNNVSKDAPPPPPESKKEKKTCPKCRKEMRYIEHYKRWYCDDCEEYD